MNTKIHLPIVLLFVFFYNTSISQTIYTYDPSGNRTSKIVQGNTPNITLTSDTAICLGESIQLNASGGVGYSWNTGQNQPSILVTPSASQYFKVIVTGANECTTTDSVYVEVNPLPDISNINGKVVIESYSQGIVYTVEDHPGSVYQWQIQGGTIAGGQGSHEVTVNWSKLGGTLKVFEISEFGCESVEKQIPVSSRITQTISHRKGWNLISLYVEADSMTPHFVFSPILPWLTQVKNIYQLYIPSNPPQFNSLKFLVPGNGYWDSLKMNVPLTVAGTWLNNEHVGINLNTGWNLVGYIGEAKQTVESAFGGIWNKFVEARSADSFYVKENPPPFNSLRYLKPGEGYWVKVSGNCSFNYPNPPPNAREDWQTPVNNEYSWQPVQYTMSTVCRGRVTLKGLPIKVREPAGSVYVGAFVDGECREVAPVFMYGKESYVSLLLRGEEPELVQFFLSMDGQVFTSNYIFQSSPGETVMDFLPLDFSVNDIHIADQTYEKTSLVISEDNLVVYPNPFTDQTMIRVYKNREGVLSVKVSDPHGTIGETLYEGFTGEGYSSYQWNGTINNQSVTPGIYILTIRSSDQLIQQKLIKY